jgi:hypothetical protein
MLSGPDLADLIAYAAANGAKIILAGDLSQLQAVENGGGMSLLAQTLGYARLAQPVRFRHAWEQQASLRLRDGDISVLAEYDQHGRIIGGDPVLDGAQDADDGGGVAASGMPMAAQRAGGWRSFVGGGALPTGGVSGLPCGVSAGTVRSVGCGAASPRCLWRSPRGEAAE